MPELQNRNNEFNDFDRFPNLDGIEYKMVNELLYSKSKYAENIWKQKGNTVDDITVLAIFL